MDNIVSSLSKSKSGLFNLGSDVDCVKPVLMFQPSGEQHVSQTYLNSGANEGKECPNTRNGGVSTMKSLSRELVLRGSTVYISLHLLFICTVQVTPPSI